MAVLSTKAIVFSAIKYNDSSLIVKCFTQEEGIKSYLIRGVLKSKKGKLKPAYFQPLTQLQIEVIHKQKSNLHNIKEVSVDYAYKTIYKDVIKQSIVIFLAEVLSNSIKEEEKNLQLYAYLENACIWLDSHDKMSNFHLLFLLNLSYFLGFYPDTSEKDKLHFNLIEGSFSDSSYEKSSISGQNLTLFRRLLGINFDNIENISFNKQERQAVLKIIIRYFELHLDGFKTPKSLPILEAVFS